MSRFTCILCHYLHHFVHFRYVFQKCSSFQTAGVLTFLPYFTRRLRLSATTSKNHLSAYSLTTLSINRSSVTATSLTIYPRGVECHCKFHCRILLPIHWSKNVKYSHPQGQCLEIPLSVLQFPVTMLILCSVSPWRLGSLFCSLILPAWSMAGPQYLMDEGT